jgi:alpha-1,6-mannosyltransferase
VRIVHVANFYGPHSAAIRSLTQHLGAGYLEAGHDPVFVVPGTEDAELQTSYGLVVTVKARRLPGAAGVRVITDVDHVCTVLEQLRPDRLEVSDRFTLRSLGWWARGKDVPSVMWSHERIDATLRGLLPGPWPATRMADSWNSATAGRFDHVVCSTTYAREEFERIGWQSATHVPLGVDLQMFTPDRHDDELRSQLLGDDSDILLVMCNRLTRDKRPELAVETLAELRRRGKRAHLVVLGTGPLEGRMRTLAKELPITVFGHVAQREDVANVMASSDVMLTPAVGESFGLAALESLASGTPVVGAASSKLGEIVSGEAGYAVSGGANQFADAVCDLLQRPETRRRREARAHATNFPWSRTTATMLQVHELAPTDSPDYEQQLEQSA